MNTQAKPSSWIICFKRLTQSVIVVMVMLLLRSWPVQALVASTSVKPDMYQSLAANAQTTEAEKQSQPMTSAEQLLEATQPVTSTAPAQVLILVAGQRTAHDRIQPNIHHATNAVYRRFYEQGYAAQHIFYLASDLALDATDDGVSDIDATATITNLQAVVITETLKLLGANDTLTLYLIGSGDYDQFYLNQAVGQILTTALLNSWLSQVEATVPGVQINLIFDQCNAGSYILAPQTLSRSGRVIIAASRDDECAYASAEGSYFSDAFSNALTPNTSLGQAFQTTQKLMAQSQRPQTPQLDANGNGLSNEPSDTNLANTRYLFAPHADAYEADDVCVAAKGITPDGQVQQQSLHVVSDQDWLQFTAEAGQTYWIAAQSTSSDLQFSLYGSCDAPPPMTNSELTKGAATSLNDRTIKFTAPRAGLFFIQMTSANHSRLDYSISVQKRIEHVYLPLILH